MRKTKYTREVLEPIVRESTSLSQVIRRLGLLPNGGNHRHISARIQNAGIDTSHFGGRLRTACEAIPVDALAELVRTSTSFAQILDALGLPHAGRASRELSARIRALDLPTNHFTGSAWARGETKSTHSSVAKVSRGLRVTDELVFVESSHYVKGPQIVERLVEKGWPYRCAVCGIDEWCGKKLVLHLDHINGIHNDNRLANLRFLCPNCHSQTATYCRRRSSRAAEALTLCYTFNRSRAWWNWLTQHV